MIPNCAKPVPKSVTCLREKSQKVGLRLLKNFVEFAKMNRRSNFAFAALGIPAVIAASFVSLPAVGLEAARLEVTPVEPMRFERRGDIYFADFGKDVYGNLQISFDADVPATNLIVRLGEKLDAAGNIDRKPPGSVNYRQVACDLDPRVERRTVEFLLKHPTWPTEWSFHVPMIVAADYEATGETVLAESNYDALKGKLLMDRAREDGLLRAFAIVDWPGAERDGYNDGQAAPGDNREIGPEINTVVNAFYYHALQRMALLAHALKKDGDAREFDAKARQVYDSFNAIFFDATRGIYIDGEGSRHASLHANMFPLAFGLVPADREAKVAGFVQSRGMACSVYGAQYLLESLFQSGHAEAAVKLMTGKGGRGWWHMIDLGSTMTLEAWDVQFKKNLTWNHAWGSAPANIISRFVLGVRPLEPGYHKILVAPQPGTLQWATGKVPTPPGPVLVNVQNGDRFRLEVTIPAGATAEIALPRRNNAQVWLDGKSVSAKADGQFVMIDGVTSGRHIAEIRARP